MTPLPFNGAMFAHDLVLALDRAEKSSRRGRPHYDERRWWRCLAEADQHDNFRRLDHHYHTFDSTHYQPTHVHYFEKLYASSGPKMNGKPLRMSAAQSEIRSLSAIRSAEA
jgi:hypothetical protein